METKAGKIEWISNGTSQTRELEELECENGIQQVQTQIKWDEAHYKHMSIMKMQTQISIIHSFANFAN